MAAVLFDTETTGIHEPGIVEAAYIVLGDPQTLNPVRQFSARYNPGKPIELGAMATHHIFDEDVADCVPASEFSLPHDTDYLIGHNVDFDWRVIGEPPVKRICTLALSRYLAPDVDAHTQSAMIYFYARDRAKARERLARAHSALGDVQNCRALLHYQLADLRDRGELQTDATWEDVWRISERARIPKVMPFGKHKGERIADIPDDYKSWLLRQPDVDPYLHQALLGDAQLF